MSAQTNVRPSRPARAASGLRPGSNGSRLAASLLGLVVLAGCSGSSLAGTPPPAPQGASSAPATAQASPATQGAPSAEPSAPASSAPQGDANVQIVKTNVFAWPSSYGGGSVEVVVEVLNSGAGVAKLGGVNSETWTLYAKDGSVLDTGDLTPMPQYLAPGATGYLGGWTNVNDSATFATIGKADASVTFGKETALPAETLTTAKVKVSPDGFKVWLEATGTITNSGSQATSFGVIGVVLLDASGQPVGWLEDNTAPMGLLPSQTKGFKTGGTFVPASVAAKVKSVKVFAYDLSL